MRSREGGFTLAEVLVSVAILGIAFVTIVGGLGSAILSADVDRRQATAQNELRALAEQIEGEAYDPCPGTPAYGASWAAPTGFTTTMSVEYWVAATDSYQSTCPLNDDGLQRVSLALTSADDRVRESLVMFKREP